MIMIGNDKKEVFMKVNLNVPFMNYKGLVITKKSRGYGCGTGAVDERCHCSDPIQWGVER